MRTGLRETRSTIAVVARATFKKCPFSVRFLCPPEANADLMAVTLVCHEPYNLTYDVTLLHSIILLIFGQRSMHFMAQRIRGTKV